MQANFENVKGYATYENAVKRGKEIKSMLEIHEFRWVVIALPNGRFAPCVIANDKVNPGWFASQTGVCVVN